MTQKTAVRLILGSLALWFVGWFLAGVGGNPTPPNELMAFGPVVIVLGLMLVYAIFEKKQ